VTGTHAALAGRITEVRKLLTDAMEKIVRVTGIAAALPRINVDTDAIMPKKWCVTTSREGLDEIGATLKREAAIAAFLAGDRAQRPRLSVLVSQSCCAA